MVIISTSVTAYLSTSVLILAATIYHARKHQDSGIDIFLVLLLLHTLYILYFLFLCRPPNIFWSLHLPLNAAPEYVRTAIRRHVRLDSDTPLPRVLETLLSRISSLEMRMLYVRFLLAFIALSLIPTDTPHWSMQVWPRRAARL